jgi:hypothetical protein
VLDALEKHGLAWNTLVLFTSDNGGRYERGAMRAGHRTNGELLGQKTDVWEGGHRVPLLARWPGRIPAASERKEFFHQVDLMVTLADASGTTVPDGASPDGHSELAALLDPAMSAPKRTEAILHGTRIRTLSNPANDFTGNVSINGGTSLTNVASGAYIYSSGYVPLSQGVTGPTGSYGKGVSASVLRRFPGLCDITMSQPHPDGANYMVLLTPCSANGSGSRPCMAHLR